MAMVDDERVARISSEVVREFSILQTLENNGINTDSLQTALLSMFIRLHDLNESEPDNEASQNEQIAAIKHQYPWIETTTIQGKRSFAVFFSAVGAAIRELSKHQEAT